MYIEQIALEVGSIVAKRIQNPDDLPLTVKKTISQIVKNAKHELEPIVISNNWNQYYYNQINIYVSKLNTPKNDKVMEVMNKYLGISGDIIKNKVPLLTRINQIVKTRGEIAHNVFVDEYLKKELVDQHYVTIKEIVKQIELLLWDYIPEITDGKRPWQNTY